MLKWDLAAYQFAIFQHITATALYRWAAAWIIGTKTIDIQLYAAIVFDGGDFCTNIKTFGIGKTIITALIADINHHFTAFGGAVTIVFFTIVQDHHFVFDAIPIEVGGFDGLGIQTVAISAVVILPFLMGTISRIKQSLIVQASSDLMRHWWL